jgi:hypothetical protein
MIVSVCDGGADGMQPSRFLFRFCSRVSLDALAFILLLPKRVLQPDVSFGWSHCPVCAARSVPGSFPPFSYGAQAASGMPEPGRAGCGRGRAEPACPMKHWRVPGAVTAPLVLISKPCLYVIVRSQVVMLGDELGSSPASRPPVTRD